VVALSAGPERVAQTIREALARERTARSTSSRKTGWAYPAPTWIRWLPRGCWRRRSGTRLRTWSSRASNPTIWGTARPAPFLAELLGLPHATIVMHVKKVDSGIRVKRELGERLVPARGDALARLLAIQSGFSKLRYATLMGIKKAKTKQVRRVMAADLGVAASGRPGSQRDRSIGSTFPNTPSAPNCSKALPQQRLPNWWKS